MRRTWITLAATAGSIAVAITLTTGTASAHEATVSATCPGGVAVAATKYVVQEGKANTAVVKLDGKVVAENDDFGSAFSATVPNPDPTKEHAWSVDITAWDSSTFDVHQQGTIAPCAAPPTTTTRPPAPPAPQPPTPQPAPPVKAPAHFTG